MSDSSHDRKSSNGFFQVPNALVPQLCALEPAALHVYLAIASINGNSTACYPSRQTIAKLANVDERTVPRVVKKLKHLIDYKPGCGRGNLSRYVVKYRGGKGGETVQNGGSPATVSTNKRWRDGAIKGGEAAHRIKKKDKKGATASFDPFEIDLPFSSEAFREAWGDWVQSRIEKKKRLTPTVAKSHLKKCTKWGEQRAIAAIENSHAYQGLFEPKAPTSSQQQPDDDPYAHYPKVTA